MTTEVQHTSIEGCLLAPGATLGDALELVRAGAPLLVQTGADGRLESVVDPIAVRVAHVSGETPDVRITGVAEERAPVRWESTAPPHLPAFQPGAAPVVAARPLTDARGRPVGLELTRAAECVGRAVLMAGGLGKRLRPLTDNLPKPLLEVAGAPLLERMLVHLERHGVRSSTVSVHYLAEQVEAFVATGGRWSHPVDCLLEQGALGTGGALGLLRGRADAPFFLVNGDIVTDVDLAAMASHHFASDAAITVATVPYEWRIPYGVVDPDGRHLRAVREKPLYRFETNAGLYLFSPRVLSELVPGDAYDMVELINGVAERGETVARFPLVEYWSDVGLPADFERVQSEVPPLA